jgi:hypothetical protein
VEALLHVDQLLHLALHQPRHGDAGPARHHLGHVLVVHLLLQEGDVGLELAQPCLLVLDELLELGDLAVAELGCALEVRVPLGALCLAV